MCKSAGDEELGSAGILAKNISIKCAGALSRVPGACVIVRQILGALPAQANVIDQATCMRSTDPITDMKWPP